MILNYLRIAVRNLFRNKLYSAINIGGLAVGLAVCMTILLYVVHEHSYDRFHHDAQRIFIMGGTEKSFGDQQMNVLIMSHVDAPMMLQAAPQVESYMRIYRKYSTVNLSVASDPAVHYSEKTGFIFVDSNFFRFLSFHLIRGDASTVLSEPNNLVLSESAAKKYFGNQDPIGRSLLYDSHLLLKVTGICADAPSNSSIPFSFVAPFSLIAHTQDSFQLTYNWFGMGSFLTLLKLRDPGSANNVAATATRLAAMDKSGMSSSLVFKLSPLSDNHLSASPVWGGASTRYLSLFTLVAGLILLLALINYMSLSTARAVTRAREVGVRKAIGADRKNIAAQFYTESALSAILAFFIGALLFLTFRHLLFEMIGLHIDPSFLQTPTVLFSFLGLLLSTILVAGAYPSLVLSAYNPVVVLYGRLSHKRGGAMVRKGFTVLQFFISIALVICTLFIGRQLKYMREADTGVDRNNVVMITCEKTLTQYLAFKREVAAMPSVKATATANYSLYQGGSNRIFQTKTPGHKISMWDMIVDTGFISLMQLQWKEKPASMAAVMDGRHPILNEVAVAGIGFSGRATGGALNDYYVVGGVVKDFNYWSLAKEIEPIELYIGLDTAAFGLQRNVLFIRFWPHSDMAAMLRKIGQIYASFDKTTAFSYEFLDDAYDSQYKAEDRLAGLMGVFSTITVIIACLGLFALATFSAQQRIKEIGIRKVLGASVEGVATSLSIDFLRPVGLSLLLAVPVSAWIMHGWLNKYAYRIPLSWRLFTEASGLMAVLALATVFFLSVKAARANPANSLRSE
ncbi:MAG TPA: FtsX-like permease family protein [Puia sp.]|jgi:putative ABC transport system permease protein|nr:FtsX-like permease family protein [Puia sp.]